ncbi:MAG: MMPL family transporter [Pseudomonadales bacterium]|nr:MMPL family transporter [Pseudomonadales bacterium]
MTNTIAKWLVQWRWLTVLMALVMIFLLASGGRYIAFAGDYEAWFDADNPELKDYLKIQRTYEKSDSVVFLLSPKQGDVFTRETLASVQWLTTQGWQMPFSTRVNSLSNFQHTYAMDDDLVVEDLVSDLSVLSDARLEKLRDIVHDEPAVYGLMISKDDKVTAVSVTVNLPGDQADATPKVAAFARATIKQLKADNPNLDVHLSGITILDNAFIEASQGDMATLTPIMFLVILTGLIILLRSVYATLSILVLIVLSVAATMGFSGWLSIPLTPPSASAPTIVMTVAVANAVHIVLAFMHNFSLGGDKKAAMVEALRVNIQPVALATVTTIVGFLSMHFSDIPPFHHLGNMAAMGVAVAFILSMTVLPALLLLLPIKAQEKQSEVKLFSAKLSHFVIDKRKVLLPSLVLVSVMLSAGLANNEMNEVISEYFDESTQIRIDSDYASEHLTGPYYLEFSLDSGVDGGVSDPAFLRVLEEFSRWMNQQPEVVHVLSISDTLKRLNKSLNGDNPDQYKLPENQALAAQYLLLYDMSLPYGMDLSNQLNIKKSSTRVMVSLHNLSTQELLALSDRTRQWFDQNANNIAVNFSSPTFMFSHISSRAVGRMAISVGIAMSLIALLIIAALGSVKLGLLSLIPNTLPPAIAFGLWGYFNGEVSFAMAVSVTIAIGIIVDDTVHFLSKYQRARKENGLSPEQSIHYAFEHVGSALIVTSLVLSAGFLVLASSTFKLNMEMGIITMLSISSALILDFLLLPVLLLAFDKDKKSPSAVYENADKPLTAN